MVKKFQIDDEYFKNVLDIKLGTYFLQKVLDNKEYFTFIHVADTHNGNAGNASRYNEYSALRIEKTTEKGINVRQDDIDNAFAQVIDIALRYNVNAVIHAGDGTDAWGYKQPYVYNSYLNQVIRLKEQGIKYLEIVGNHNLPKRSGVGCYLESLGKYPGVYTSYKGYYESIDFTEDDVVIHCVPSTFTQEILDDSLDEVHPVEGKINIGVGHFGVTSIKHYAENQESTLVTSLDKIVKCDMDYFALGDYHDATDFGNGIRYSGSILPLGFGEVNNQPRIIMVAIHKDTKERIEIDLPIISRPMIDLKPIDATDKTIERIKELIIERLTSQDLTDAIVRLRVNKLPKAFKSGIDTETINKLTEKTLYFKLDLKDKTEDSSTTKTSSATPFEGILEGWNPFMDAVVDDGTFNKKEIRDLGYEYLAEALE